MTCLRQTLSVAAALAVTTSLWGQSPAPARELNPLHLSAHHVTASVADLEKEAAWYERVLGFQRSTLNGDPNAMTMYQMTMPGYRIDLVHMKGSTNHRVTLGNTEQGWLHVIFKTADLAGAYKALVALGTDVKADKDGSGTIVHIVFHDPEGNELGIVRP